MDTCLVVAIDVGTVKKNYAWTALRLAQGRAPQKVGAGTDALGSARVVSEGLRTGPVAIGWEAPGSVPIPDREAWAELGHARTGEGSRPWSAGAGAGALATGLAQAAWLLRAVADNAPGTSCTCDPRTWHAGGGVLLWEAFVSGPGKPGRTFDTVTRQFGSQHEADADAAAARFDESWQAGQLLDTESDVTTEPHRSFNLLAAAALAAGLAIDPSELTAPLTVLRTPPVLSPQS